MPDADRPAPDATSGAAAVTLILVKNGTVKSYQKISETEGGFTGILDDGISSAARRPRWVISTAWATWPWGSS